MKLQWPSTITCECTQRIKEVLNCAICGLGNVHWYVLGHFKASFTRDTRCKALNLETLQKYRTEWERIQTADKDETGSALSRDGLGLNF